MTMKNADLISASKKVMDLAAKRRQRMASRKVRADGTDKPGSGVREPLTPEEEKAAADKKLADKKAAAAKNAKPAAKPAPAAAKPAPVAQPAVAAKAKVAAKGVKATENGGFEGGSMSPTGTPDMGDQEFGYAIPPELESAIDEGTSDVDDSFSPGILIPPGLEDAVMAVTDPEDMPKDEEARFDLIPFVPEDATTVAEVLQAGAHWILCANGEPLAKITLKDQDHSDKIAGHFVSPDFAKSIIDGISKHGLGETLKAVKAKPYVAKVNQNKKIMEIKAKLEASSAEAVKQKVASIKAKFVQNLGLVLEASAANFIVENPLKDALIASLTGVGLPENVAAEMVDDAFFSQGNKTLAGLLDKSEEWSNLTAEALKEITAAMQSAGRRSRPLPSNLGAAHTNPNYDQALANKMAAGALPVTPAPHAEPLSASMRLAGGPAPVADEKKAAFRSKFGKFSTY